MNGTRAGVLAERTLHGHIGERSVQRLVVLMMPKQDVAKRYQCEVILEGGTARSEAILDGRDAFEAIQNALMFVATDIYVSAVEEGVHWLWDDSQHSGFPSFPGFRLEVLPALEEVASNVARAGNSEVPRSLSELFSECTIDDVTSLPGINALIAPGSPPCRLGRGDLVAISRHDGDVDHALVISPADFNQFGQALVCPVEFEPRFTRAHGFAVVFVTANGNERGAVQCNLPYTMFLKDVRLEVVGAVASEVVSAALAKVNALLQ